MTILRSRDIKIFSVLKVLRQCSLVLLLGIYSRQGRTPGSAKGKKVTNLDFAVWRGEKLNNGVDADERIVEILQSALLLLLLLLLVCGANWAGRLHRGHCCEAYNVSFISDA